MAEGANLRKTYQGGPAHDRERRAYDRAHAGERGGHMGLLGPPVPGGHGPAPLLHVLPEHAGRALHAIVARIHSLPLPSKSLELDSILKSFKHGVSPPPRLSPGEPVVDLD